MPNEAPFQRLIENIGHVVFGKEAVVETVVAAFLARGHVLMEDVPGVGKTVLARTLAASIDARFGRVQCTPDLLPSDVTGVSVYNPKDLSFAFREGPVFSNVLLADEVNRATPRTQSALLEAMEERQVSIDGVTHKLPDPFFLIATQNPIEMAGTFPLPEAQLDRFMARVSIGYPDDQTETAIMLAQRRSHPLDKVRAVVTPAEVLEAQKQVAEIGVHPAMAGYIQSICAATRKHEHVRYGASPRGAIALMRIAQAKAMIAGERFITPDHVKGLARAVLAHRIVIRPRSRVQGMTGERAVDESLATVPVPVELEMSR